MTTEEWDEPDLVHKTTGARVKLVDVDGPIVERFQDLKDQLYTSPWGDSTRREDVQVRHHAGDRMWECAYAFVQARQWDARTMEPDPEWLVNDVKVEFRHPARPLMPNGWGLPIMASLFYARAFYLVANQALDLLFGLPDLFPEIAVFSRQERKKHPIIRVRNQLIEHPIPKEDHAAYGGDARHVSLLASSSFGDASQWGPEGPSSLTADVEELLSTFERSPKLDDPESD